MISVIGDGVFFHSGFNAITDSFLAGAEGLVIIADNQSIAMTGGQSTPAEGRDIHHGKKLHPISIEQLLASIGIENVEIIDPYELDTLITSIARGLKTPGFTVIISRRECLMKAKKKPLKVNQINNNCTGCFECSKIGCLAMVRDERNNFMSINSELCAGCGLCQYLCHFGAIDTLTLKESIHA